METTQTKNEPDLDLIKSSNDINHIKFIKTINILYRNIPLNIFTALICASVIYIGLLHTSYVPNLALWYVSAILISAYRLITFGIYKYKPFSYKLHYVLYLLGSISAASCWGIIDSLMMPPSEKGQMIIIIIVAGISAGSIQTLHASLAASISYISLSIIPLIIWLFAQNQLAYYAIGFTMATYYIFLIFAIRHSNKVLMGLIELQFSNLELINKLSHSNNILLQKNELLKQHEHEIRIINNMDNALQLCQTIDEIVPIIKSTAEALFKDYNGGLTLTEAGNQHLRTQWGNSDVLKPDFL